MARNQADSSATTGYEAELWAMADMLRGSMDAAEYKHVLLGLIFLKHISDAKALLVRIVEIVGGSALVEYRDPELRE